METTGVVRRIDELGRIVIPKEIRKSLGIKEGTTLEFFLEKDMVALKKCSTMNNLTELSAILSETVYNTTKKELFITDCDNIISCPNNRKKDFLNQPISSYLETFIKKRTMFKEEDLTEFSLTKDMILKTRYEVKPIEANGDIIGLVILISEKRLEENDDIVVNIASKFLGKNVEE